ncbi:MAG: tripartite tricarboxylate transporter substrate-binding protein [Bradyrhizobium sp.]
MAAATSTTSAPAKTPEPVLAKLADATKVALQNPALRKSFAAGGFETASALDPASARAYVAAEIERWKPLLEQFASKRQ